jgi:ABC-type antimicrobial peptide transport system permease subunit
MLMPQEMQQQVFDTVLKAAVANNPTAVDGLLGMISMQTDGITVTKDNFVRLMPVLDIQKHIMFALAGAPAGTIPNMPVAIPGLVTLAGEEAMSQIYSGMTESFKQMTVTEEIFLTLLTTMKADDKDFIMIEDALYSMAPQTDATLDSTLKAIGDSQKASPMSINFYAKDFASKEQIEQFITDYNDTVADDDKIEYTDLIGIMMSSVSIIIDVISYVLIAFVSISLVVSSIMIGIITNISVLERTKEIGILRAIGASKKDVSRVFKAETFIIGLAAGILGILTTILLCFPTNAIIQALTGFENIKAVLPPIAALILVVISMGLTIIAGLIPSKKASKKDPVEALRTE